ncbi:hypothetical protein KUTeg_001641, partial [Tegillarca granosa]
MTHIAAQRERKTYINSVSKEKTFWSNFILHALNLILYCMLIIVFIICWSPYFIWNLLDVYGFIIYNSDGIKMASIFIQSLAPLNSAANPIIYGIFSTRICRYL